MRELLMSILCRLARRSSRRQRGVVVLFSVFVLMLLGFSLFAGMHYIGPRVDLKHQASTSYPATDVVKAALRTFVARNYRLPCPADGTAPIDGVGTVTGMPEGVESCSVVPVTATQAAGVVPWKTLGLQPSDALDGWGRRIGYAVTTTLSNPSAMPFQFTASTALPNGIGVATCTTSGGCGTATTYAYVLISYGPDGKGGFLTSGSPLALPSSTANEYVNTQAAAFNGTGNFEIWPYSSTAYDDTLTYDTAPQLCTAINGSQNSSKSRPFCNPNDQPPAPPAGPAAPNSPSFAPALGMVNTDVAALAANPQYQSNTYAGCGSGAIFCPGSFNTGSLANTYSYIAGGGNGLNPGDNCATQVGNVGVTCVFDPLNNDGIVIGNSTSGVAQNGDWIGPNTAPQNPCPQCYGGMIYQYMVPTQTLTYIHSTSFQSFAAAAYLVDGGMQMQVDGYQSNVCGLRGDITFGSPQIQNVAPVALLAGATLSGTGIPAGTTAATGPSGGSLTMSAPATASAAQEAVAVSLNLTVTGTLNLSQTVTGVSSTTSIGIGDTISGQGIPANTIITAVGSTTLTLSNPTTLSGANVTLSIYGGSTIISGSVTAGSSTLSGITYPCPLSVGQLVSGLNYVPSGTTISTITNAGSTLTLTNPVTDPSGTLTSGTLTSYPLIAYDSAFNFTGQTTSGSTQVSTVSAQTITGSTATAANVLVAGQSISGPGIPARTYIAQVAGNTITLSQPAYATSTGSVWLTATPWVNIGTMVLSNSYLTNINRAISVTGSWTQGSPTVTSVSSSLGLAPGEPIAGYGIPPGTAISAVSASLTLSQSAQTSGTAQAYSVTPVPLPITASTVNGSNLLTSVTAPPFLTNPSTTTPVVDAQPISGTGIPTGTTITCVPPGTATNACAYITLSAAATLTQTGVVLDVTPASLTVYGSTVAGSSTLTATGIPPGVVAGQGISGPGIATGTTIATGGVAISLTLSQNALLSQNGSLYMPYEDLVTTPVVGTADGSSTVTGLTSTTGLVLSLPDGSGQPIGGAGTPEDTTIAAVPSSTSLTMNQSVQAATPPNPNMLFVGDRKGLTNITGTTTAGSTVITNVTPAGITLLAAEVATTGNNSQPSITGNGIPFGTVVTAIDSVNFQLTISNPANNSISNNALYFADLITGITGNLTGGSTRVANVTPVTGLVGGNIQFVASPGLLPATTITTVGYSYPVLTISNAAQLTATGVTLSVGASGATLIGDLTAGSTTVLNAVSTALLTDGESISGTGLSGSTTITSPTPSPPAALILSQSASATVAGAPLIVGYYPPTAATIITTPASESGNLIDVAQPVVPMLGQTIVGAGVPSGTLVSGVVGGTGATNAVALSNSASVTSGNYLFSTYAACPGPAAPTGLYASNPSVPYTMPAYAPVPQHPSKAVAATVDSQIWPQPTADANGLAQQNYVDQRDYQFTNRQFLDGFGNTLVFNILQFQVYPYTFSNASAVCAQGSYSSPACAYGTAQTFRYGLLFEGEKGCFFDAATGDCVFAPGSDEWANPPVTVTQDCGQRP
jgi:hypothetical protein